MWPIATDAEWSVPELSTGPFCVTRSNPTQPMDNSDRDVSLTVCLCVRLSDTTVSPAEMAEPIEIVWGMDYWRLKKPRWRPGSPTGRGTFRGSYFDETSAVCWMRRDRTRSWRVNEWRVHRPCTSRNVRLSYT